MALLFTPGQLRNALSLPPETYRHWKKALEPLRRGTGHGPCFTSGDLLAASILRAISKDLDVRVGSMAPIAERLFDLCNSTPWPTLERSTLVIRLAGPDLHLAADPDGIPSDRPTIVMRLAPALERLRDGLLAVAEPQGQQAFRFPPVPLRQSPEARGTGR